jgi:hypothetical protein
MVVVRLYGLIGNGCFFINLLPWGVEAAGVGDGTICVYNGSSDGDDVRWFGSRLVRYRYCTDSVVDPMVPCIDCVPSDDGWLIGQLEIEVRANFKAAPPGTGFNPDGWIVVADLYTESHGFFGHLFVGGSSPRGDCAGVTGLPNQLTFASPDVVYDGFADVIGANTVLPP